MHGSAIILYLILLLQNCLEVSSRTTAVSVCSSDTNSEPSISTIFESLISPDVSELLIERLSSSNLCRNAFNIVSEITLPFKWLISDGIFNVDMTTDHFFFRDVLLIQKNGFFTNTLCSILPMEYNYIRRLLCECSTGRNLSKKDIEYFSSTSTDFNQEDSHRWCVRNPCTNKSSRDGACVIAVDPFRTACILVLRSSIPAPLAVKIDQEADHEDLAITPFTTDLIKFNLSTPFMTKNKYGIDKILSIFRNEKDNKKTYSSDEMQIPNNLRVFEKHLDDMAAGTPTYLFNFIIGSSILLFSEDLASSFFLQCIISILFGIVLLFLWFAMAVVTLLPNLFSGPTLLNVILNHTCSIWIYHTFRGLSGGDYILDLLVSFWKYGAFEIDWLGKGYFLGSMIICIKLYYVGGPLPSDSLLFKALWKLIELIGLYFLSNFTLSVEISYIIVFMMICKDSIRFLFFRLNLYITASPSSFKYIGRKLTNDEFDAEGKIETQNALNKLQQYLQNNPEEVDSVCNYSPNITNGSSTLLDLFILGEYSGRPSLEAIKLKEKIK